MQASRSVAMSLYLNQREMKIPIIILSGSLDFQERAWRLLKIQSTFNGEKLQEDYETSKINDVGIVNEKIKLGSDEYFVLGDDRQNSEDSRNANVGNVNTATFTGKAWFVISPNTTLDL